MSQGTSTREVVGRDRIVWRLVGVGVVAAAARAIHGAARGPGSRVRGSALGRSRPRDARLRRLVAPDRERDDVLRQAGGVVLAHRRGVAPDRRRGRGGGAAAGGAGRRRRRLGRDAARPPALRRPRGAARRGRAGDEFRLRVLRPAGDRRLRDGDGRARRGLAVRPARGASGRAVGSSGYGPGWRWCR